MKIRFPLLVFVLVFSASLLCSQTQAPDASLVGPSATNFGAYSGGASAVDNEVLPGCVPVVGYDCNVQLAGEYYVPNPLNGTNPVLIFLHGNHATCGHAYNPPPGGSDPAGLPGAPRIDDDITYTGTGACSAASDPLYAPSYRGYDYLANLMASWGYVVISIDVNRGINGINAPMGVANDYRLIRARGVMVLKTLELLNNWNINGDVPGSAGELLQGHLDLSNVGLMGHSRGGEGVRAALSLFNGVTATPNNATNPWPTRIPGLNIKAIFEIGPTDSGMIAAVGPPMVITPFDATGATWNVLLPMCDGDVSDLEGVRAFDRNIMALETPPLQKSTYTVWGANHNFFNTQWQVSEDFVPPVATYTSICTGAGNTAIYPVSPSSTEQQLIAISSLAALFRGNVGAGANIAFNQNFNPPFGIPATIQGVAYPSRVDRGYSPPGSITTFDDFTVAGFNSVNPAVPHVVANVVANYGTVPDHDPVLSNALNVSWAAAGANNFFQTSWTPNGTPGIDVRSYQTLDIRVSRENNALNAAPTDLSVSLVGANGVMTRSVSLNQYIDPNFAGPAGQQSNLTGPVGSTIELHPILQTVRIPLTAFGNFAFIGPQVHGVRLTFDRTASGSIYVTNIRLSTQIGGGAANYPSIPAPPPAPLLKQAEVAKTAPVKAAVPVVHAASIVSITKVAHAAELVGGDGYRIRVKTASGGFPIRDAGLVMAIGEGNNLPLLNAQYIKAGYEPMVKGQAVFTLTTEQYQSLRSGAHVILAFGESPNPGEYWDCKLLP